MSKSDGQPARKKRKTSAVTTKSLLDDFLLLKTAFDDTILKEELVEDLDIANGSGSGKGKDRKRDSLASHPALPYILKDINEQRISIRQQVKQAVSAFARAYDARPLGKPKYDVEPDEQKALLQEKLTLQEALDKLRERKDSLQSDMKSLQTSIKTHEKTLTKAVDDLTGKQKAQKRAVASDSETDD